MRINVLTPDGELVAAELTRVPCLGEQVAYRRPGKPPLYTGVVTYVMHIAHEPGDVLPWVAEIQLRGR